MNYAIKAIIYQNLLTLFNIYNTKMHFIRINSSTMTVGCLLVPPYVRPQLFSYVCIHLPQVVVVSLQLELRQVRCLNPLRCVSVDVHEPRHHHVNHHHQKHPVPEVWLTNSCPQNEPWHQDHCSHTEDVSGESVVLHGRITPNEMFRMVTDFFALTGWVTEGDAGHINVWVGVGPY